MEPRTLQIGVDVGGTFTDVVALDSEGQISVRKVLSTPADYSAAVIEGIEQVLAEAGAEGGGVAAVVHATTVATNAILTHSGARTGLITTKGFRDVLEFGRLRMPKLFDMDWERPQPLVARHLRNEVEERMAANGEVIRPISDDSINEALTDLVDQGIESLAISLINSYANPEHERRIERLAKERFPGLMVTVSSELLPELKEFERTSTAVVNAYVQPVIKQYFVMLGERLRDAGVAGPLLIMQSNGGVVSAPTASEAPVYIIESGPAAGAVAAMRTGQVIGVDDLVSFDMGGTTAKACIIEKGNITRATEYEVGAGLNVGHRLLRGGGYLVRVPTIDIAEVGAGGGSIAWLDAGNILKVGPRSAGASPGPVCYGQGGTQPTVTDANVALGYLNQEYLVGGAWPIDADAARRSLTDHVAVPAGLNLVQAAHGVHRISNAVMARAVRAVSIERGRDPRRFALFAFGGSGPVHAAHLALDMGIGKVVVPPAPGLFSSVGLLLSNLEHHYVQNFWRRIDGTEAAELQNIVSGMSAKAYDDLASEGYPRDRVRLQVLSDMRYVGQNSELTIPLPEAFLGSGDWAALREAFEQEHQATYGYRSTREPIQFINLRIVAEGLRGESAGIGRGGARPNGERPSQPQSKQRQVYFGPEMGWLSAPVIDRPDLDSHFQEGPLIIEEYDSTTVAPPHCRARLDEWGNINLELGRIP